MKLLTLLLSALVLTGCGQRSTGVGSTEEGGEELWGRTFSSVSVTDERSDDEPESVTVGFEKREDGNIVRWSGCNATGSIAHITTERIRLDTGPQDSTTIGCPPEEEEGDRWLLNFFGSDPYWELDGDRLTLTSANGSKEILLEG